MPLLKPGDMVGSKYRVDDLLGEGGFGEVFLATTLLTGRRVAIKVLKPPASGEDARHAKRFRRELRAIAKLQSPYTLTLLDYGETDDGLQYSITEYVEGEDLSSLLSRRGTLAEHEVAHILAQLLRSLQEAHNFGILHRDIKPANIRVFEYEGDPLRAKLLDFGIAYSLRGDEARLTQTGRAIGTPRYMSPEQRHGDELTPASDIYSLGLVAYDALVGARRASSGMVLLRVPDEVLVSSSLRAVVDGMLEILPTNRSGAAEAFDALAAISAPSLRPKTAVAPAIKATKDLRPAVKEATTTVRPTAPETVEEGAASLKARVAAGTAGLAVAALIVVAISPPEQPQPVSERVPDPPVKQTIQKPVKPAIKEKDASVPADDGLIAVVDGSRSVGCLNSPPSSDGSMVLQGIDEPIPLRLATNYDHSVAHPLIIDYRRRFDGESEALASLADSQRIALLQTPHNGFGRDSAYGADVSADLKAAMELACVDPNRIYVVARAARAPSACGMPGVRAIAETGKLAYESALPGAACDDPIPFLFVAARDSVMYPFEGGPPKCIDSRKGPTGRPLFNPYPRLSVREFEQSWKSRNSCSGAPKVVQLGPRECKTWRCKTPFVLCETDGGIRWADQEPLAGATCIDATSDFPYPEVIWAFFQSLDEG